MSIELFFKKLISISTLIIIGYITLSNTVQAATWTADPANPNRISIRAEYIPRIDAVVLRILSKGKDLQASVYPTYISNVSRGVAALGAKPEYSSNAEITSIIKYITYELNVISANLSSNDSFFEELVRIIDSPTSGTGATVGGAGTGATTVVAGAIPAGYCYYDEGAYRARGLKMTVTSADSETWITANNMKLIGGKLYLPGRGGMNWSFWKISDNQLTNAMISCYQGQLSETGMAWFPPVANTVVNPGSGSTGGAGGTVGGGVGTTSIQIDTPVLFCAGNGWPAEIAITANDGLFNVTGFKNGQVSENLTLSRDTNTQARTGFGVYRAQVGENSDEYRIILANKGNGDPLYNVKKASCTPSPYPAKPVITSANYDAAAQIMSVSVRNALSGDNIDIFDGSSYGGLFWTKNGDNTGYTASLKDPSYSSLREYIKSGNANLGIYGSFDVHYYRNGIRNTRYPITIINNKAPTIRFVRDGDGIVMSSINNDNRRYGANWTTENITSLTFSCTGPVTKVNEVLPLQLSGNYASYQELKNSGWKSGDYQCIFTGTGPNGTTNIKDYFTIQ
jgi:hypothetical protein